MEITLWPPHLTACLLFISLQSCQILQSMTMTTTVTSCRSGRYTTDGECCRECPPGDGAISICDAYHIQCEHCKLNSTFSASWGIDDCRPCRLCESDEIMIRQCNTTRDTTCRCRIGHFRKSGGGCSQCSVCPPGLGTIQPCHFQEDIICEACVPLKTYSDTITRATMCKPCSRCGKGTHIVQNCTAISDTVCSEILPQSAPPLSPRSPYHPSISIVPLYCVLLAALVVGLLLYVVFKRWTFNKVKLRPSQQMVRSNTSTTDIEKDLHNMNGSQLLSTTYSGPTSYTVLVDPSEVSPATPYKELHSDKKLELEEKLTLVRNDERDWRGLSALLHFEESDKTHFIKMADGHCNPVRIMFHKWQSRDGDKATADVIVQALNKLQREDLASLIPIRHGDV